MNLDNIIGIVTDFLVYRGPSFARPKFETNDDVWFQFQFPEFKISNSGNISYHSCHCFGRNEFMRPDIGRVRKLT